MSPFFLTLLNISVPIVLIFAQFSIRSIALLGMYFVNTKKSEKNTQTLTAQLHFGRRLHRIVLVAHEALVHAAILLAHRRDLDVLLG